MLSNFFTPDVISLNVECKDWYEAVAAGAELLIKKNYVEPEYVAAIINNHTTLGPYMVIAPGIMLSHARPEDGVNQLALSLITLKTPLPFGNVTNDPVKLVITLAAKDRNSHLKTLSQLTELLMCTKHLEQIMTATDKEIVIKIIRCY